MTTETNDSFDDAFAEVVASLDVAPVEPVVVAPVETPVEPVVVTPVEPVVVAPVEPVVVAPVETPEAKTAREAFETSISPYAPTEDEVKALAQFKIDFPNEALAVEARLKSVDRDINARVYQAVKDYALAAEARLAPVEQAVTKSSMDAHFTALHTAHADYDAVIAKVPDWIKTLPSYAQAGAQAVYDQGSTQDVIALVSDYKKANPMTAPAAPAAPAPKPPPAGADDLAPVNSRRVAVTPTGTPDPNDFDGAWAEISAALK